MFNPQHAINYLVFLLNLVNKHPTVIHPHHYRHVIAFFVSIPILIMRIARSISTPCYRVYYQPSVSSSSTGCVTLKVLTSSCLLDSSISRCLRSSSSAFCFSNSACLRASSALRSSSALRCSSSFCCSSALRCSSSFCFASCSFFLASSCFLFDSACCFSFSSLAFLSSSCLRSYACCSANLAFSSCACCSILLTSASISDCDTSCVF